MKSIIHFILILIIISSVAITAQDSSKTTGGEKGRRHKRMFVDKNGDGYNDNAPDHDNDGIPNGLDPDYTGLKRKNKNSIKSYIDRDGDGINDNINLNKPGLNNLWMRQRNKVEPQNRGNNKGNSNQDSKQRKGKGGK
jgi:hypothetical protein